MITKYRFQLPAFFGLVSSALMIWDIHNLHVIAQMGMAWDTGAPVWPYQTARILLDLLNAPAYIVANPISNFLGLVGPASYLVILPTILAWWWLVGLVLDRRVLKPTVRKGWSTCAIAIVLAALFFIGGAQLTRDTFRLWLTNGSGQVSSDNLLLLRFATPAIWCFMLGATAALYGVRLLTLHGNSN
jgi:hypothetical protein